MEYGITRLVLGCQQFIELRRDEYVAAKRAKTCLVTALSIEEKLDLLLENYAELDLELQTLTTRHYLFQNHDWSSFRNDAHTINRRLANLLSAGRLYIDQTRHNISELFGPASDQLKALDQAFAEQYDAHLGYRVLEALRNHVQHRSLPVHTLTYKAVRDDRGEVTLVKHICIPSLSVSWIEEQGNFKGEILQELKRGSNLIDLRPLVRQYLASLGQVHVGLRERMSEAIAAWDAQLESIKARFHDTYGDHVAGLAVVIKDEQGVVKESSYIVEDLVIRRKYLEKKNHSMAHLRAHYTSTEPTSDG